MVTFTLLVIGGLNWLLFALFNTDIGALLGGGGIATVIYVLVGISAIAEVATHKSNCKFCGGPKPMADISQKT